MSLSKYIHDSLTNDSSVTERLHISNDTKSTKLRPKTKDELRSIIEQELERQGPDADLNNIDTSWITDMSGLFEDLNIKNIKIDKWDVSSVTDMSQMFTHCKKFNSDLSGWDVSNVTDMSGMFYNCASFKCYLSGWDVSNVKNHTSMFKYCPNMIKNWELQPDLEEEIDSFVY